VRKCANFSAPAVLDTGEIVSELNFSDSSTGSYSAIIFYPLDFTFVCPSELIALDRRIDKFNSLNLKIFTVSVDSHFTHHAWRNTLVSDGGIGKVRYTMVADINHGITQAYGVESASGVAFRATFLIDKEGIVRHQLVNDLPLGRNMDELIRITHALQFHEENGEVCPAGWNVGDKGMIASSDGVRDYLSKNVDSL
jgi:peroxiredoxin (alkyl hydroperoxide reductase subunit C)